MEEAKKRPGSKAYYKGTPKSNKQMSREINKCAKEPRPKSCYDDWSADKTYRKSQKGQKAMKRNWGKQSLEETEVDETIESVLDEALDSLLDDILHEGISAKTRETLKKKAEDANIPLGALTAVYRKGMAAWLTGHRQGVVQHQWAMGRVNSFIKGGKARQVDAAEWEKVKKHRKKKKK